MLARALVFEPLYNGHHLQYVRILLEALQGRAQKVQVVLGEGAMSSQEFSVHLADFVSAGVTFSEEVAASQRRSRALAAAMTVLALRRAIRVHRPERVYAPYGDGIIQALGLTRLIAPGFIPRVPLELLMMRGGFGYPSAVMGRPLRHELLYRLAAKSRVDVLHVLDPLVHADIERRGGALARSARVIPEAVEALPQMSAAQARAHLGLPLEGRYIVCAGALDERKGVPQLLRAAAEAALPEDVRVLLVGRWNPSIAEHFDRARATMGDRLILIDRYVDELEFACAILAADVVAVPYPDHQGSSGLLVRAVAARRFVLASDYGWIGWVTRTFRLGHSLDVSNPDELRAGLLKAVDAAPSHRLGPLAKRWLAFHEASNQRSHWRLSTGGDEHGRTDTTLLWRDVVRGITKP